MARETDEVAEAARICDETDGTPGIWLVRELLSEGGLAVQSERLLDGQPVPYARTVVMLDADVVTWFLADAARSDALVAAHYDKVARKVDRLADMRKAVRWAAASAATAAAALAGFATDAAAGAFAPAFDWLLTAGAVAGGGTLGGLAVRELLHRQVRKLKQLLD